MNRVLTRTAILLALLVGIGLAIANRDAFDATLLETWVNRAGIAGPVAFVLIYALGTILFLPGSVLTLAGGALFGPVLALAVVTLASRSLRPRPIWLLMVAAPTILDFVAGQLGLPALGPGERVLDRMAHVGDAQLRLERPVNEFDHRVDDAGRMHDDTDPLRAETEAILECMGTADWKEGLRAFAEKRPPQYRGE